MNRIKQFEQFVNESLTSKLYHFTRTYRVIQILDTNSINMTPVFGTKSDSEINNNKLYALSLTSSRHSDVGYAQSLPKRQLVRITMDGDSLNNNYKSKRVDYWQRPKDPKDPMYNDTHSPKGDALYKQISRQDELEDRLISDKNTIKNANKYITKIEILNGETESLENIKYQCDELNIEFHAYDEQKYFDGAVSDKAINVEAKKHDIETHENSFNIDDLIVLYLYNNEDKTDSLIDEIIGLKPDIDTEKLKEYIEKEMKNVKYRLRIPDSYNIKDYESSVNSYIHNNKRTTDEVGRFIIHKIGMDMKKSKSDTLYDYIESKIYKGKKRQSDFNKEYVDNINKYFKGEYPEIITNRDYSTYKSETDEPVDSVLTQPDIKEFLDKYVNGIKKIFIDYASNNKEMYKDYYGNADRYIIEEKIGFSNINFDDIAKQYQDFEGRELKDIISLVIRDLDDLSYDFISNAKEESMNQWRS